MSEANCIPLKDHFERILAERELARCEAAKVLQAHLDNLNHFREESQRKEDRYLPRELYYSEHERLSERVKSLEEWKGKAIGVSAVLVVLAGLLGGFIGHILIR